MVFPGSIAHGPLGGVTCAQDRIMPNRAFSDTEACRRGAQVGELGVLNCTVRAPPQPAGDRV